MMEDREPDRDSAKPVDREHRAEIVDRLYDVALDPIRLRDLLAVWEGHVGPMPHGAAEPSAALDDPEIEAHLGRAKVFLDRFEATRADGGYRSVLADIPRSAAFISDGFNRIAACNRAATVAFRIAEGASLAALPFEPEDVVTLSSVIRKVASRRAEKVVNLRIRSTITGGPVIVRVSPLDSTEARPLALVISTELVWPEGFEQTVQEAFGLTPAEVEIVRGLTLGLPIRDIAEARGRSVDTVRTQVRSILAKTETHSQAELVRVILGLMDVALTTVGSVKIQRLAGTLAEAPVRTLTLPDGRKLDWIEFGNPVGAPCLFMHMDYGLTRWPAPAEREAKTRGIRVIVPVRAGYGTSDPHAEGIDPLQANTVDYAAVLDRLGIRQAAVLALGADLRFAINLSLMRPGLVTGILGCAVQLPLKTTAQYERMDKWQRFILANARFAPKVLPFLIQAAFSLARRLGKEAFFAQINGGSPADMAAFADPHVREAVLVGTEVCVGTDVSAHEAYTRDCISAEKDWSGIVRACKVPVLVMQGDQDPQTPAQTIRELMAEFPSLDVEFVQDAGQLLFFAHWLRALDRLERFLPR